MEPLFSIIIPVYNSAGYLSRCVESVINQDFADFELLLVDDCSIDGSHEICTHYQNTDKRVRVFRNAKNEGVTITRNRGIEESVGRFILFVDNDDYLDEDYLSAFAAAYEENPEADLIIQNVIFHKEHSEVQIIRGFDSLGGPWGKTFKRSILLDENIRFIPKLRYNEDNMFMLDYLEFVERKVELDIALYHYIEHEGCTSKKIEVDFEATGQGLVVLLERLQKDDFRTKYNRDFAENRAYFMFYRFVKSLYACKQHSRKRRRNNMRKVCDVSVDAVKYYPLQYKSDRLIKQMLVAKCFFTADILAEFFWRLRMRY